MIISTVTSYKERIALYSWYSQNKVESLVSKASKKTIKPSYRLIVNPNLFREQTYVTELRMKNFACVFISLSGINIFLKYFFAYTGNPSRSHRNTRTHGYSFSHRLSERTNISNAGKSESTVQQRNYVNVVTKQAICIRIDNIPFTSVYKRRIGVYLRKNRPPRCET